MNYVRVVKLGGSLWSFEALIPALRDWLAHQSTAHNVILVGGGAFAETVRHIDQRFGLDPEKAHWLCVRLMDTSARMMSLLLPEAVFIDRYEELQQLLESTASERPLLFSAEEFLQRHESRARGARLPNDWCTTSDSIAARVAHSVQARELVLLKSADPPTPLDLNHLARRGYVDSFFPQAVTGVASLRLVNLRTGCQWRV